jgi:hypothetical protein
MRTVAEFTRRGGRNGRAPRSLLRIKHGSQYGRQWVDGSGVRVWPFDTPSGVRHTIVTYVRHDEVFVVPEDYDGGWRYQYMEVLGGYDQTSHELWFECDRDRFVHFRPALAVLICFVIAKGWRVSTVNVYFWRWEPPAGIVATGVSQLAFRAFMLEVFGEPHLSDAAALQMTYDLCPVEAWVGSSSNSGSTT